MNRSNVTGPLQEALRVLALEASDLALDPMMNAVLTGSFDVSISAEKEQSLLDKLYAHFEPTLGAVLQEAMGAQHLTAEQAATELKFPSNLLQHLLSDAVSVTNVPVVLFKNLLTRLQLPIHSIEQAAQSTFHKLKAGPSTNNSVSFASFRRDSGKYRLGPERQESQELFESDEALKLYIARLKELLDA